MTFERYAIFYAPETGSALDRFGTSWLDRDHWGYPPDHIEEEYSSLSHRRMVAAARRYGFHGTLKAPFRLANGADPERLKRKLHDFAIGQKKIKTGPLQLLALGGFLALTPKDGTERLSELAARCVEDFDSFRAPLSKTEWVKRQPERLTDRQRALLDQWGYPYVMDAYRFHITLAGPLDGDSKNEMEAQLAPLVAPICKDPFEVNTICLFGDPGNFGDFLLIERYALS